MLINISITMASQSDSQEINLIIEDQVFKVHKNVLCEYSDYFSAMFSGNYVEQDKTDICIDVVDAKSMDMILRYFNVGLIDLSEFSLETIGTLAMAANFLQITELNKQIEYWLDLNMTESNCMEIMGIAEKASYLKLEKYAQTFALLNFNTMKPEHIPNLQRLFWYLSHPYLYTMSEYDVFKFGYKWILHPETCVRADILLIVLGCIDYKRLTYEDLKEIMQLIDYCENSLAEKVVHCIKMFFYHNNKLPFTLEVFEKFHKIICEGFTQSVYNEVFNLVKNSIERKLKYTAVAAVWEYNQNGDLAFVPHCLYTFEEDKYERWLEVADKNIWGWNMAVWGATKIVLTCGEYGRGMGRFVTDVRVYDTLREEWTQHGVTLPCRRHAGLAVTGDSLFIVGGVGAFRVIVDTTIIYDLRNRTHRKAAKFPEAIQSPAICTHFGSIYASGHKNIYKFEDLGEKERWVSVLETDFRPTHIVSYMEYIYCSHSYFNSFHRFRPGINDKLEIVTWFRIPPVAYCNMKDHLVVFGQSTCNRKNSLSIVRYQQGPCKCLVGNIQPNVACKHCNVKDVSENSEITVNDVAGGISVVMTMPKVNTTPSSYHQRYLSQYGEITYNMGVEEANG